jgi:menaquinone-dependent protoporphyrinogen oxidase
MKVLVAYATCHGSTRCVAEHLAERLRAVGHEAKAYATADVHRVSSYEVAVLGSAVHNRAWLTDGVDFLTRFNTELADRPVWLFSVGMPAALPRRLQGRALREEESVISAKLAPMVRARGHRLFSGAIERDHLSLTGRLGLRVMGARYGDFTDWQQVDAWASEIATELEAFRPSQPMISASALGPPHLKGS